MTSDEELMRLYQKGQEEAFNLLYEKYSPMVYSYIKRRMRPSLAPDLFQKVWRRLHEKRESYQGQPFAPWLFVLTRNLLIDEYRSLGRRKKEEEALSENFHTPDQVDDEVEELLKHLPQETQELVRKYYLEGVSYEELEVETGLSQTNLRQRLSRALRGLRKYREE